MTTKLIIMGAVFAWLGGVFVAGWIGLLQLAEAAQRWSAHRDARQGGLPVARIAPGRRASVARRLDLASAVSVWRPAMIGAALLAVAIAVVIGGLFAVAHVMRELVGDLGQ